MEPAAAKTQFAWQPFTPRGVAAFAEASLSRLLVVQLIVALIAGGTVVWFLKADWYPVVAAAAHRLPQLGVVKSGRLEWPDESPVTLAENPFAAVTVDLEHRGEARSPAHVQVEFGREDIRIFSLLGALKKTYPRGWTIAFNREEVEPWWGAWAPMILVLAGAAVMACLFLVWTLLASVYWLVAWLIGFFANRDLTLRGSWRLAGASLMPGALFLSVTIFLYGEGAMDVVKLMAAAVAHLVIGWIYVAVSPLYRPRHPAFASSVANPFTTKPS